MPLSRRVLSLLTCSSLLGFAAPRLAFAEEDGAKIFAESCSSCHTAKTRPLDDVHLTREQWKEAIDKMIPLGAEVPEKKIPALLDYLARTHGPAGTSIDGGK